MNRMTTLAAALMAACFSCAPRADIDIDRVDVHADVIYGHKFGLALTLDVYQPSRPGRGAVIFVNSGGYESGQLRQWEDRGGRPRWIPPDRLRIMGSPEPIPLLEQFSFIDLLRAGLTVFDLRHGSSPKFTLDEIVADVGMGAAYIKAHAGEYGVDPDRLALFGASSGGHLAIYLALTAHEGFRFRGVGAYYPVGFDAVDTLERFPFLSDAIPALRVDKKILAALSLRNHISPDAPPLFIVYGEDDFPFVTETCESLKTAYEADPLEFRAIAIPGTAHEFRGTDGYQSQNGLRARKEMAVWLSEHLK